MSRNASVTRGVEALRDNPPRTILNCEVVVSSNRMQDGNSEVYPLLGKFLVSTLGIPSIQCGQPVKVWQM